MTHVEILRRAREAGHRIPDSAISQVLSGARRSDTYADAIAAGLGVDVAWLVREPRLESLAVAPDRGARIDGDGE